MASHRIAPSLVGAALGAGLLATVGATQPAQAGQPDPSAGLGPRTEQVEAGRVRELLGGRQITVNQERIPFAFDRQRVGVDLLGSSQAHPRTSGPQLFGERSQDLYQPPGHRPTLSFGLQWRWQF
ncbi:MAG: hypothetical protein U1E65_03965 [Myxococcota bacterium]